jgi:hypothetical protein
MTVILVQSRWVPQLPGSQLRCHESVWSLRQAGSTWPALHRAPLHQLVGQSAPPPLQKKVSLSKRVSLLIFLITLSCPPCIAFLCLALLFTEDRAHSPINIIKFIRK